MAPSKALQKFVKQKPTKQLELEVSEAPTKSFAVAPATQNPVTVLPPVTAEERARWDAARARQKTNKRGQPEEGWATRVAAMEADGRLYRIGKVLHKRE